MIGHEESSCGGSAEDLADKAAGFSPPLFAACRPLSPHWR